MLKKIILELKGKQITLTLEQAKELHGELNELFAEKSYVPYYPYFQPYPSPYISPTWYTTSNIGDTTNFTDLSATTVTNSDCYLGQSTTGTVVLNA